MDINFINNDIKSNMFVLFNNLDKNNDIKKHVKKNFFFAKIYLFKIYILEVQTYDLQRVTTYVITSYGICHN